MSGSGASWLRRGALVTAGAAITAVAVLLTVRWPGEPGEGGGAADGLPHTGVEIASGACGKGRDRVSAGRQTFDLRNTTGVPVEVYLKEARGGAVLGEVEGLGPGTTRALRVDLGGGSYAFACYPDDGVPFTGRSFRVAGTARGGPAAVPVSQHDLIPPTLSYQKWVTAQLGELVTATGKLRSAIEAGDLDRARDAWLPAHLDYERLGAAYGAFGDADAAINGTTAGLPGGVRDQDFTGFHRVEQGLWHGESAASLRAPAEQLAAAVSTLRTDWAQARMDPLDLGLRAHEIMENTVQFELTGRTDHGSGSNLATARANLDGTRAVLSRLRPLLITRYPRLPRLEGELDLTQAALDRQNHDGHWTAPGRLPRAERQKVNAAASGLVERLADIAALCDVRRSS